MRHLRLTTLILGVLHAPLTLAADVIATPIYMLDRQAADNIKTVPVTPVKPPVPIAPVVRAPVVKPASPVPAIPPAVIKVTGIPKTVEKPVPVHSVRPVTTMAVPASEPVTAPTLHARPSLQNVYRPLTTAQKAEIAGTDRNNNGMRDDADKYLPRNSGTPVQRAALIRLVRAYTEAMTTPLDDTGALAEAADNLAHARQCAKIAFKARGAAVNEAFTAVAVNTTVRMNAYHYFKKSLSGVPVTHTRASCDDDI